jgi:hypothetical protein
MREFVGNTIRLKISNVVPREVYAPFLEIPANNFGVVAVIIPVIVILVVRLR